MQNERRRIIAYNRTFYMAITGIFAILSGLGLLALLFQGVTELRLMVTFVSLWYLIYMMDLVERRFQRHTDNVMWRKLFSFRGPADAKPDQNNQDRTSSNQ